MDREETVIEIKSFEDIVKKVPKDSIDFFIEDLRKYLNIHHNIKSITWISHDTSIFKRIDDWKNIAKVSIKINK